MRDYFVFVAHYYLIDHTDRENDGWVRYEVCCPSIIADADKAREFARASLKEDYNVEGSKYEFLYHPDKGDQ